jgi:hypothetical protein
MAAGSVLHKHGNVLLNSVSGRKFDPEGRPENEQCRTMLDSCAILWGGRPGMPTRFLPRDSVSLSGKLNFFKENQETSLATTRELSTKCSGHCSAWTRKCVADKCVWYKIWHGGTSWKWAGRTTHVQPYGGALAAPTQCHVFKGPPDQEIGACFLPVKVDLHLHSFEFLERNQATSNITCAKVTRDWSCRMQDMSCVRKTGHTD